MVKEYLFNSVVLQKSHHDNTYNEWILVTNNLELILDWAFKSGLTLVSSKVSNKGKTWTVSFKGTEAQHSAFVCSFPPNIYSMYNIEIKKTRN